MEQDYLHNWGDWYPGRQSIVKSGFRVLAMGAWVYGIRGAMCTTIPSTPAILVFTWFFTKPVPMSPYDESLDPHAPLFMYLFYLA